jgi:hypothetical protein
MKKMQDIIVYVRIKIITYLDLYLYVKEEDQSKRKEISTTSK